MRRKSEKWKNEVRRRARKEHKKRTVLYVAAEETQHTRGRKTRLTPSMSPDKTAAMYLKRMDGGRDRMNPDASVEAA